ncbi:MAG: putative endonuclease, partial [Candidatus Paceibacteria bacterium]
MNYFVYILRCADDSLYTGITTDLKRRVEEHNGLADGGAK